VATALRDVPTYFVVGTSDALLAVNQTAYGLLHEAGNPELTFVTFPGGHDYRQQDVEQMYLWLRQFDNSGRRPAGQDAAPKHRLPVLSRDAPPEKRGRQGHGRYERASGKGA
jgi:hypothetical protein